MQELEIPKIAKHAQSGMKKLRIICIIKRLEEGELF